MTFNPATLVEQLAAVQSAPRWLVAFSGGVDSLLLLQLAATIPDHPPIVAVHVNHGLQARADDWQAWCEARAQALGVDFHCSRLQLQADGNIEDTARRARYAVFESLLGSGDVLLMAHHADDQMETLLLRMLRGSGSRGLAAMPVTRPLGRGRLLRPLLHCSKAAITAYASAQGWQWIEDPSNACEDFDRNYLRRRVLPAIAERWPEYRATLGRAIALSEEAEQLNRELAELDCHALSLSPLAESLPLAALAELSPGRLKNLLRYWLQCRHLNLPSAAQMQALIDDVIGAGADAEPLLEWPGVQVRRFRDELYAMRPLMEFAPAGTWRLDTDRALVVQGCGELALVACQGAGIAAPVVAAGPLQVRFRRGGERCRPAGRSGSQTLKKLLQEYAVATWIRDRVPLLYQGEALVAVGDYWVCEGYTAAPGEPGYTCHWQRRFYDKNDNKVP